MKTPKKTKKNKPLRKQISKAKKVSRPKESKTGSKSRVIHSKPIKAKKVASKAKKSSSKTKESKKVPLRIAARPNSTARASSTPGQGLTQRQSSPQRQSLTTRPGSVAAVSEGLVTEVFAETKRVDDDRDVSGVNGTHTPQVLPADEIVPATPVRQPTRKIVGPGKTLITLEERSKSTEAPGLEGQSSTSNQIPSFTGITVEEQSLPSPVTAIPLPKLSEIFTKSPSPSQTVNRVSSPAPEAVKYKWTELPNTISKELKGKLLQMQERCSSAGGSPFPFAKYISSLPSAVCGRQFAMVVAAVDSGGADTEHPQELQGLDGEELLNDACSNIVDLFASLCPGMYRTWKAQIAARSLSVRTLIEHHLVSAVDPEFQETIAAITLRAMGVERPWAMGTRS